MFPFSYYSEREGERTASLRDIRPPPIFSSPLFILVIKLDFCVDFGEVFIRKGKKGGRGRKYKNWTVGRLKIEGKSWTIPG
jgi:hypothetical protein